MIKHERVFPVNISTFIGMVTAVKAAVRVAPGYQTVLDWSMRIAFCDGQHLMIGGTVRAFDVLELRTSADVARLPSDLHSTTFKLDDAEATARGLLPRDTMATVYAYMLASLLDITRQVTVGQLADHELRHSAR